MSPERIAELERRCAAAEQRAAAAEKAATDLVATVERLSNAIDAAFAMAATAPAVGEA